MAAPSTVSVGVSSGLVRDFGEFAISQYVAAQNVTGAIPHIQDGMQRETFDYNIWASYPENKEYFVRDVLAYVKQSQLAEDFINQLCEIEYTDKEVHLTYRTEFSNTPAVLNAPGTLIPYITQTQRSKVTVNTYHQQSFDVDYYTMDTAEGREDVELKVKRMALDVIRTNINSVVMNLFAAQSGTRMANQRNGEYTVAQTPLEWAILRQKLYAVENKMRNAVNAIVRNGNEVMSQYNEGFETKYVICSLADAFYLNEHVYMTRAGVRSGTNAGSVSTIELPLDYGRFKVLPLPMIHKNLSDKENNTFERPSVTRSAVNFSTKCHDIDPRDYRSYMRDQWYAGKEGMSRYSLLSNIQHQMEYDQKDPTDVSYGHLDYDFLGKFAAKLVDKTDKNLYRRMRIKEEGNQDMMNEYLFYHPGRTYLPTVFMGQIPEQRCKNEYMDRVNESFAHVLGENISGVGKTNLINYINDKKGIGGGGSGTKSYNAEVISFLEAMSPGNPFCTPAVLDAAFTLGGGGFEWNNLVDAVHVHIVATPTRKFISDECFKHFKVKNSNEKDNFIAILNATSEFKQRAEKAYNEADAFQAFCSMANLFSLRTLQNAEARHNYHIQHPTGGMNLRFEVQMMSNVLLVGSDGSGSEKLAKFYMGPPDHFSATDQISKIENIQMGFSHGVGIKDERLMHWVHNVRGGRIAGGFDRNYANPEYIKTEANDEFSKREHLMTRGSNIAIAASYNQAVNGLDDPRLRVFDARGYFHDDLCRYIDGTDWLRGQSDKDNALCAGLATYVFGMGEGIEMETDSYFKNRDRSRLNFNDENYYNQFTHVHTQLNSWTWDPRFETNAMSPSYHPWGVLDEHSLKYLTSESNMVQEDFTTEKMRTIKKQRFDAVN
jgi:hypothetical protein